ncbi:MAG: hypothetical protein ABI233_01170 [Chthoniobacterales bacterium]
MPTGCRSPFWDAWFTPAQQLISLHQGTLSLSELFSQHNESRPFFPRLLMILLAAPAGWDARQEMVLTFATVCAGAGAIYLLFRRCSDLSRNRRILVWAITSFLLFAPCGYENFLNPQHFGNFVPSVALLFALVINAGGSRFAIKACANASLAFIATYSMPHGLFLWLFAWPIAWQPNESPRRTRWRVIYCVAALVSIAGYFWGYRHPTVTPPFVSPFTHFGLLLHYLTLWSGDLFFLSVADPLLLGILVLALFSALAAAAIFLAVRDRNWRPGYPWLVLGIFTLVSGFTGAAGRLGFGLEQALDQRYTSYTVFLYIAIVGLAAHVLSAFRSTALRLLAVAVFASGALLWGETLVRITPRLAADERMRKHLLLALEWAAVIPDNPELQKLSPYPETPRRIQELIRYDILRPRAVSGPLAEAVRENPARASSRTIGELTGHPSASAGQMKLRASAGSKKPNCVVIGFASAAGKYSPVAVFLPGEWRTIDLTHFLGERGELSGWAVYLKQKRASPLSGTVPFGPIR